MEKKYEIAESYGILGSKNAKEGTQTLELHLIKWFGGTAKLDLRWWSDGAPSKGVTFTAKEAIKLRDALIRMNLGEDNYGKED
jgi:hypothetical protein